MLTGCAARLGAVLAVGAHRRSPSRVVHLDLADAELGVDAGCSGRRSRPSWLDLLRVDAAARVAEERTSPGPSTLALASTSMSVGTMISSRPMSPSTVDRRPSRASRSRTWVRSSMSSPAPRLVGGLHGGGGQRASRDRSPPSQCSATVAPARPSAASRPSRISPPARPKNAPTSSITPLMPRARAGYAEPATPGAGHVDHPEDADRQRDQRQGEPEQDRPAAARVPGPRRGPAGPGDRARRVGRGGRAGRRTRPPVAAPSPGRRRTGPAAHGGLAGPARLAGRRVSTTSATMPATPAASGKPSRPSESPSSSSAAIPADHTRAMPRLRSSRLILARSPSSSGSSSQHGAVEQQPGAAEEGEHHERHPHDHGVDVEVPGQAAGDAGDCGRSSWCAAAGRGRGPRRGSRGVPAARPGRRVRGRDRPAGLGWGRCHGSSLLRRGARAPSGTTLIRRAPGAPGPQGSGRGRASWSGPVRSATHGGAMTHCRAPPPDAVRGPSRHPRHAAAGHRRRRRRARAAPRGAALWVRAGVRGRGALGGLGVALLRRSLAGAAAGLAAS